MSNDKTTAADTREMSRTPSLFLKADEWITGQCIQGTAGLFFGFITHGQLLESPAGEDRVAFITQRLEVDIIRGTDQVADVAPLGGHVGKVGTLVGNRFEIHISIVLVTAVAGALTLEAFVTLRAGERRLRRHDLVLDPPQYMLVRIHSYLPLYFMSAAFMPSTKALCQSRCFQ